MENWTWDDPKLKFGVDLACKGALGKANSFETKLPDFS